jgi:hypothetical protein
VDESGEECCWFGLMYNCILVVRRVEYFGIGLSYLLWIKEGFGLGVSGRFKLVGKFWMRIEGRLYNGGGRF